MTQQELNKLLGLESLDQNGMPVTDKYSEALAAQNNPHYETSFGDYTPDIVYNPGSDDGVIYRGEGQDINQTRFDSQKGWARAKHGVTRLAGSTLTKALEGTAFLGALAYEGLKSAMVGGAGVLSSDFKNSTTYEDLLEGNVLSRAADNGLSAMIHHGEEFIKDSNPIFKPTGFNELNPLQKLMTSSYLYDEVFDGIAFMLSTYIPGGALAKAKLGARLANTKGMQGLHKTLLKAKSGKIRPYEARNVERLAKNLDQLTMGTTMTAMEATFEGKEVMDSIRNNKELRKRYTDEEIEQLAHQRGLDAFALNMLMLAPSNAFEVGMIFNKGNLFKRRPPASRSKMDTITGKGSDIVAAGTNSFASKAGKFYNTNPWMQVAKAAATEGLWEENIQYSINKLSSYVSTNALQRDVLAAGTWDGIWKGIKNIDTLANLSDQERLESIMLGSVIGGGSTMISNNEKLNRAVGGDGGLRAQNKAAIAEQEEILKYLEGGGPEIATSIYKRKPTTETTLKIEDGKFLEQVTGEESPKVYETQEEFEKRAEELGLPKTGGTATKDNGLESDAEGNLVYNEEFLKKKLNELKTLGELQEIEDVLGEDVEGNANAIRLVRNSKVAEIANRHFELGVGEYFYDKLDGYAAATEEELNALGFTSNDNVKAEVEELKEYVRDLEDHYNAMASSLTIGASSSEKNALNEERRAFLTQRGSILLSIKQLSKGLVNKMQTELTAEDSDIAEAINELNPLASTQGIDLKDPFKDYGDRFKTFVEFMEERFNTLSGLMHPVLDTTGNSLVSQNKSLTTLEKSFFKLQQLQDSYDSMYADYIKSRDSFKYFKENKEDLYTKYDTSRVSSLILNSQTTVSDYIKYENTQLKRLKLARAMHKIDAHSATRVWRQIFVNTGSPIQALVELEKNQSIISKKDLTELDQITRAFRSQLESQLERIKTLEDENAVIDLAYSQERETDEQMAQKQTNLGLIAKYEAELKEFYKGFGINSNSTGLELISKLDEVWDSVRKRAENGLSEESDKSLKKSIAENLFKNEVKVVKSMIDNNPEFDDVSFVERSMSALENLKRILSERKKEDFKSTIKKIDQDLKTLKEFKEEVEERLKDRKRNEKIIYNSYVVSLFNQLGIDLETKDFTEGLGEKLKALLGDEYILKFKKLLEEDIKAKETDPDIEFVTPNEALVYALIENLRGQKESTEQILEARREELINNILSNPHIKAMGSGTDGYGRMTYGAISDALKKSKGNILKASKFIISKLSDQTIAVKGVSPYDYLNPKSGLFRFLQHQNLFKLSNDLVTEKRPKDTISSEDLKDITDNFAALFSLEQLQLTLNSEQSMQSLIEYEKILSDNAKKSATNEEVPTTYVPSMSQRISIYQLIKFYLSENKDSNFGNWAYLKGPAGSGKTTIILKWLMDLLGLGAESVMTAGHNSHSSKIIKENVQSTHGENTVQQLLEKLRNDEVPESVKLIVIDEIAAIPGGSKDTPNSIPTMYALSEELRKFTAKQKAKGVKVKVMVLGDPNQITTDSSPVLESYAAASIQGLEDIVTVPPLTVRYRSDNPAILATQDAFLHKSTEVTGLVSQISERTDLLDSTNNLVKGSYVESTSSSLLPLLFRQFSNDKNRNSTTRVIVVGTSEMQKEYTSKIVAKLGQEVIDSKQIEVVEYREVQGRTIDEVYVDLSGFPKGADPSSIVTYNTAMYTATSRSKEFLYVANVPGSETVFDPAMNAYLDQQNAQDLGVYDTHLKEVEEQLEIYKELSAKDNSSAPEEQERVKDDESKAERTEEDPAEEEATSTEEDSTEEDGTEEPPAGPAAAANEAVKEEEKEEPTIIESKVDRLEGEESVAEHAAKVDKLAKDPAPKGALIKLKEVSSNVFYPLEAQGDPEYFKGLNDKLENKQDIPAKILNIRKAGKVYSVIALPQPVSGEFVIVAYLTQGEAKAINALAKTDVVRVNEVAKNVIEITGDVPKNLPDVIIRKESSNIKYLYDESKTRDMSDARGVIKDWIDTMNASNRSNPKHVKEDHTVEIYNEEEIQDKARIVVLTEKDLNSKKKSGYKGRFPIQEALGLPFIWLKGIKRRTNRGEEGFTEGDTRGTEALIPLRPKKLNQDNHGEFLEPIREFIKVVKEFENLLAKKYPEGNFKLGYNRFAKLVTNLSDILHKSEDGNTFTTSGETKYIKTNFKTAFELFPYSENPQELVSRDPELFELAKRLDVMQHGEREERSQRKRKNKDGEITIQFVRNFQGEAQKAFDAIAMSNLTVVDKDNSTIILRDSRSKGKDKVPVEGARPILGNSSITKGTIESRYQGKVLEDVRNFLLKQKKVAEAQGLGDLIDTSNIPSKYLAEDRLYLSSSELDFVFNQSFDSEGDSNANRGFGLRVPIQIDMVKGKRLFPTQSGSNKLIGDMSKYLETDFTGVRGPEIIIEVPNTASTRKIESKQSKESKEKEKDTKPTGGNSIKSELDKFRESRNSSKRRPRPLSSEFASGEALDKMTTEKLLNQFNPPNLLQVLKRFVKKAFGRSPLEEDVYRLLDVTEMKILAGKKAWGAYQDGIRSLLRSEKGGGYKNAVIHESVHAVVDGLLKPAEKAKLYNLVIRRYPNLQAQSIEDIDEFITRRLTEYASQRLNEEEYTLGSYIKNLFKRMLRALRIISRDFDTIEDFFNKFYTGFYGSGHNAEWSEGGLQLLRMDELDTLFNSSIPLFNKARTTVLETVKIFHDKASLAKFAGVDIEQVIPYTFHESVELAKGKIQEELEYHIPQEKAETYELIEEANALKESDPLRAASLLLELEKELEGLLEDEKRYEILNNDKAFRFLIQDLYDTPHTLIQIEGASNYDTILDTALSDRYSREEEGTVLNMQDEISAKDSFTEKKNTTKSLKLALSNIWTKTRENESTGEVYATSTQVPFKKAFALALDIISGLNPTDTLYEQEEYFNKQRGKYGIDNDAKAIIDFFSSNLASIDKGLNPNISFYGDGVVAINKSKDSNIDLNNYYLGSLLHNPPVNVSVHNKQKGEFTPNFLRRLADEQNIPFEDMALAHEAWKARELHADIATGLMLVERQPKKGTKSFYKGKVRHRYGRIAKGSNRDVYISDIKNGIASFYYSNKNNMPDVLSILAERKGKSSKNELTIKREIILGQLARAGINTNILKRVLPKESKSKDLEYLFKELSYLYRNINALVGPGLKHESIEDFLAYESSFTNALTKYLSAQDIFLSSSTFINGEGKRIATKKKSSFGDLIFDWFERGGKKPEHLKSDFYSSNIFLNETNTILERSDHDTIGWSGNERGATVHKDESSKDWFDRNFVFQFMAGMISTSGKSYEQQIWTTSDKPDIRNIKVNFLNNKKVDEALLSMINQEKLRPTGGAWDTLKHYTPEVSYLLGLNKVGELSDTDALEAIKKALVGEASKLFDELSDERYYFTEELEDLFFHVTGKQAPKKFKEIFEAMKKDNALQAAKIELEITEEHIESLTEEELAERKEKLDEQMDKYYLESKEELREAIMPLLESFVSNWYINSHQLNQLVAGDQAIYKTGKETNDIIKRMSIVFAPGVRGLVGGPFMKKTTKVSIIEDLVEYTKPIKVLSEENRNVPFESTDAQGYVTPEYLRQLQLSQGGNASLDTVLKPVYFGFDKNGVPRAIKFSAVVLTDELVERFPGLGKLRKEMNSKGVDMATFASALKVGSLNDKSIAQLYKRDADGKIIKDKTKSGREVARLKDPYNAVPTDLKDESIIELPSEHMRIQLNASKKAIGSISNPSQLPYLAVINENIINLSRELLEITAKRMQIGSEKLDRVFKLANGMPTDESSEVVYNEVKRSLESVSGSEMEAGLLNIPGISLNIPILADKAIRSLGSIFSKNTSNFKVRGGKLVLQSAFGTNSFTDAEGKITREPLQWKDDQGFTEVYVTEQFAKQFDLKVGDQILDKALGTVAFRIPSTGLHSAIILKIKGTYPSPSISKDNIIIAPAEIVHRHGSDYDVDSLMFITRNRYQDVNKYFQEGGTLQNIYDEVYGEQYSPEISDFKLTSIVGYNNFKPTDTDLVKTTIEGESLLDSLYRAIDYAREQKENNHALAQSNQDQSYEEQAKKLGVNIIRLESLISALLENQMVDKYIEILSHKTSTSWMELPITMDYLSELLAFNGLTPSALDVVAEIRGVDAKDYTDKDSYKAAREEALYPTKDAANVRDHRKIHASTFTGTKLTGVSANAAKILAYIFMSTPFTSKNKNEREPVKLLDSLSITLDGGVYNSLQHKEMTVDNEGNLTPLLYKRSKDGKPQTYTIWESIDSLINASIDNVKEQIIDLINLNQVTSNAFFSAIGLGIPLNTVVKLMSQKILIDLAFNNKRTSEDVLYRERSKYINIYLSKLELTEEELAEKKKSLILEDTLDTAKLEAAAKAFNAHPEKKLESAEHLLTQIQAINAYIKLNKIGDSLFEGAQQSLLLRQVPTDYVKSKNLVENLFQNTSNTGVSDLEGLTREAIGESLSPQIQEVQTLLNNDKFKEAYELLSTYIDAYIASEEIEHVEAVKNIKEDLKKNEDLYLSAAKFNIYKKILARDEDLVYVTAKDWPFVNSTLLNVPNFIEGFTSALKFNTLVEHTFWKHSKGVTNFALKVLKENFGVKPFGRDNYYRMAEAVKNDILKYLSSGMSFDIQDGDKKVTYDMTIPDISNKNPKDPNKKLYGLRAWTYRLGLDLRNLKQQVNAYNEANPLTPIVNPFLDKIVVDYNNSNKEWNIYMTAHKSDNMNVLQVFRTAFNDLNSEAIKSLNVSYPDQILSKDSEYSDLQMRLFKYLILTRGLSFGATAYTELLSDGLITAYSEKLEEILESTKSLGEEGLVNEKLDKVLNSFSLQFARNNSETLKRFNHKSVELHTDVPSELTFDGQIYRSDVILRGNTPKFISFKTKQGTAIYVKMETVDSAVKGKPVKLSLYRKIGKANYSTLYTRNNKNLFQELDLNKVITPANYIFSDTQVTDNNKLKINKDEPKLSSNQVIFVSKPQDTGLESMSRYKVVKFKSEDKEGNITYDIASLKSKVDPYVYSPQKALESGSPTTVSEVQKRKLVEESLSYLEEGFSTKIRERINFDTLKIEIVEDASEINGRMAAYSPYSNTIFLHTSGVGTKLGREALAHELVHAAVEGLVEDKRVTALLEQARKATNEEHYGLLDEDEFIAEAFSNPLFRNFLESHKVSPKSNKNLLQRLWDLIRDFLGFSKKEESIFEALKGIMETNISVNKEVSESTIQYKDTKVPEEGVLKKLEKLMASTGIELVEESAEVSYYRDSAGRRFKRLTKFLHETLASFNNSFPTAAHYYTELDYKRKGLSTDQIISFKDAGTTVEFTYAQRLAFHQAKSLQYQNFGKLAHALIERFLTLDEQRKIDLTEEIKKLASDTVDEHGNKIPGINRKDLKWLEEDIANIVNKSGIIFDKNAKPGDSDYKYMDKVHPEMIVSSEITGIAARIDAPLEHSDGSISLIDYKTQSLLSDQGRAEFMKWGLSHNIRNTKLSKAKLQIVKQAMMIKERFPETKFKELTVAWINERYGVRNFPIDLAPYLALLRDYYKNEKPEEFAKMQELKLFDADTYYNPVKINRKDRQMLGELEEDASVDQMVELLDAKIESITNTYTEAELRENKTVSERLQYLTEKRIQVTEGSNYKAAIDEPDLNRMNKIFINLKDSRHKLVQAWSKTFFKQKQKAKDQYEKDWKDHDDLYRKVIKEYFLSKGQTFMAERSEVLPINKIYLSETSSKEMGQFMWTRYESSGKQGYYANLSDTYIPFKGTTPIKMTEAQKAYRDFFIERIHSRHSDVLNQPMINKKGKQSTKGKVQRLGTLEEDFMPRIAPTANDIKEKHRWFQGRGKELAKLALTSYVIDNYQGDPDAGIPMRYAAQQGSPVIENEEHSFNVERTFKYFTQNLATKYHVDSAYALGKSVKHYAENAPDKDGGLKYKELSSWLDDMITLHVLGDGDDANFHYREWNIKVPKTLQNIFGEEVRLDAWAIGRLLKTWTSLVGMAVKPVQAGFNGALIILTNHFKAATNSLTKAMFNVPKDQLDYTLSDIWEADKEYIKYLGQWFQGKGKQTKLWNMSKNLNYLPTNYDYAVDDKSMLFVKNRLFSTSTLYYFHTMFENYGAHSVLTAMSKKLTYTWTKIDGNNKGETKVASMWDMYNEEGHVEKGWVRGYKKTSTGKLVPLTGFTVEEIEHMKKVYERMHGSYRQEERLTLELTILGQFALQFKKYLPTLIKENYRKGFLDPYVGFYKQIENLDELELDEEGKLIREQGYNVYEWEAKMHEGRILTGIGLTRQFLGLRGKDKNLERNTNYDWDNLGPDQKASLVNLIATFGLFVVILPLLLLGAADDDDEQTYVYKRTQRLFEDLSLGFNPQDILRPITSNPFPSLSRLLELMDASVTAVTKAADPERDSKGWKKGTYDMFKNMPGGSSLHSLNVLLRDYDEEIELPSFTER